MFFDFVNSPVAQRIPRSESQRFLRCHSRGHAAVVHRASAPAPWSVPGSHHVLVPIQLILPLRLLTAMLTLLIQLPLTLIELIQIYLLPVQLQLVPMELILISIPLTVTLIIKIVLQSRQTKRPSRRRQE